MGVGVGVGVFGAPDAARAQLSLLRLEVAPGPGSLVAVEGAEVAPPLGLSFHVLAGMAARPLELERRFAGLPVLEPVPVAWQGAGELGVALGLPFRTQVGLVLPFAYWQTGEAALVRGGGEAAPGVGDLRYALKWQALRVDLGPASATGGSRDGDDELAVALTLHGSVPSGQAGRFLAEEGATVTPGVAVHAYVGPVRLYADLGYRIRAERRYADLAQGNELLFGAGLSGRVLPRFELGALVHGGSGFSEALTPAEVLGVVRARLGPAELTVAGGAGITDAAGAPAWRVLALVRVPADWLVRRGVPEAPPWPLSGPAVRTEGLWPEPPGAEIRPRPRGAFPRPGADRDGDGVPDHVDRCPAQPEDPDNFQDEDGCPEPDNDADGVPDWEDRCPNDRGSPRNGGCP